MKGAKLIILSIATILVLAGLSWGLDSLNVTRLGSIYAQVDDGEDIAIAGNYAYVASYEGMAILDVSDPATPTLAGFCGYTGAGEGIALQGDFAYVVANFSGLHIINIADPASPEEVGSYYLPEFNRGVAISGAYAYVANHYEGMSIIDVSVPANPVQIGFFDPPGTLNGVAISGNYAFLAAFAGGVRVVDISDPTRPVEACVVGIPGSAQNVTISGHFLYVATYDEGLQIVEITNPLNPVLMGNCPFGSGIFNSESYDVAVSGQYAYVGVGGPSYVWQDGVRIVDISNPWAPTLVGQVNEPGYAYGVAVSGTLVCACGAWVALDAIDVSSPTAPTPLAYYSVPGQVRSVRCQGEYAYVADADNGFRVVDVSDPSALREVGHNDIDCYALDIQGQYAYLLGGKGGLAVVDVSIPSAPSVLGSCFGGWYAQDIFVSGDYAYVADQSLRVNDISDPEDPTFAGSCSFGQQCAGVAAIGDYAFVTTDGFLHVVDVTNPASPVEISSYGNLPGAAGIGLSGDNVYVACGTHGLHVVSIANPMAPIELGWCETPGDARRVDVIGNYAYVADGHQGLRVIDISNSALPVEAGYYDTPGWAREISVSEGGIFMAEGYSLGVYQFHQSDITVSLVPMVFPIQIPANGGSFDFYIFADNGGLGPQSVDLWTKAILPGGSTLSPILGSASIALNPGMTGWYRLQNVPAAAPPGDYLYIACAGNYPNGIWASDSLQFAKLASGNWGLGAGDWSNTGESFEIANDDFISHNSSFAISAKPNPFNPSTAISYQLTANSHVSLKVYDSAGRLVATLVDGWREAGEHEVTLDGSGLAAGIYVYRLTAGEFNASGKLVLLK